MLSAELRRVQCRSHHDSDFLWKSSEVFSRTPDEIQRLASRSRSHAIPYLGYFVKVRTYPCGPSREPPALERLEQECREGFVGGAVGVQQAAVEGHRLDLRNSELAVSQSIQRVARLLRNLAIADAADCEMPAPSALLAIETVL